MKTRSIFLFSVTILFAIACSKSDNNSPDVSNEQIATFSSVALAENDADVAFNDVLDNVIGITNAEIGAGVGISGKTNANHKESGSLDISSFDVIISPATPGVFPKTVTIDFGTGHTTTNGHVIKGKMITVYTGKLTVPGNEASTTFENYYIDSVKLEGLCILENVSTNDSLKLSYQVQGGKLTAPSGNYIHWNKQKTWTRIEGSSTPLNPLDDVYRIIGEGNGSVKKGDKINEWTSQIVQPIIRKLACKWITQGTVQIQRNSLVSVLNYGNGNCDNQATLTINNKTYNITLP